MATQELTSVHNPHVKAIASLHTAKGRAQAHMFIGQGQRVCQTLVGSTCGLQRLYVTRDFEGAALQLAPQHQVCIVTEAVMKKISASTTPSGFLGVFAIPAVSAPKTLNTGLVLAQISDPGNAGTLIRSAAAFGFKDIVVVDGADVWSPKVVQASGGTIGHVRVIELTWDELAGLANRPPLVALVVRGGASIKTVGKNVLLVVGNEAHGLPENWAEQCQERVTLPMPGGIESVNAAIAGSIALYLVSAQ